MTSNKILHWLGFTKKQEDINEDKNFTIEHYPITNRYYPKYKNFYLQRDYKTGIVFKKEEYLFAFADNFKTEKDCYQIIELFKEQQLKENIKTIKYDTKYKTNSNL